MDVLTSAQRKLNMSRIRSKDTKPELILRRALHAAGLRFRLHRKDLPGRPDLVFPSRRAVVFVHGCFWHGHEMCRRFKAPSSQQSYWLPKISGNVQRDLLAEAALRADGWRILKVWECCLVGRDRLDFEEVVTAAVTFLNGEAQMQVVRGKLPISE